MPETYRCAACNGTFPFGDHDRADAEAVRNGVDPEDCVIVCDPCFQAIQEDMGETIAAGPALH